jgi:ribonuclease J
MFKYKQSKISYPEIIKRRRDLVVKVSMNGMKRIAEEIQKQGRYLNGKVVFSLWSGYLDKQPEFNDFCNRYKLSLIKIHFSGHGSIQDLQTLALSINPKKILPIHTLAADSYQNYFDNVTKLEDGEIISI